MIRFIVVDDEVETLKKLKKIIRKAIFNIEESVEIKMYNKYNEELKKAIKDKSQRTICILDIDLQSDKTGINIAQEIRKKDWDTEIIFLTNHDQYFEKVYRNIYKVFDFIEKFDNMEERLTQDIIEILKQKYDTKMFKFSNRQIDLQLYLKNILYIYRDTLKRKAIIVTTHNQFIINKNIKDLIEDLDNRFVITHRSCIVNLEHVTMFKWNKGCFILDNDEEVFMLSKKYKDTIKEQYEVYEKVLQET